VAVHYLFYHFFLKAAVGEQTWKQACMETKDNDGSPLGTRTDHAFTTMFTLTNNYFVWLAEAKIRMGIEIVTDYNTEKEKQDGEFVSVCDAVFGKQLIYMDAFDEKDLVVHKKALRDEEDDSTNEDTLVQDVDNNFDDIKDKIKSKMKEAAKESKASDPPYKELKKQVEEAQLLQGRLLNIIVDANEIKQKEDKLRKERAKRLCPYTGAAGGSPVSRSTENGDNEQPLNSREVLEKLMKEIKDREQREKLFRKAYRRIYRHRNARKRKSSGLNGKPTDLKYQTTVWDVEDVQRVTI
jgi:hypothetical protein